MRKSGNSVGRAGRPIAFDGDGNDIGVWLTVECERALYVDFGINVVACDRLPSGPVTLIVKMSDEQIKKLRTDPLARVVRPNGDNGPQFNRSCSCAMCRSYFNSTPN